MYVGVSICMGFAVRLNLNPPAQLSSNMPSSWAWFLIFGAAGTFVALRPISHHPTAHPRASTMFFLVAVSAIPFERSVPVAGDNYRHLERAGDWVHPTGGPASAALGRGGDLGRRHSHVHASSAGHGLASAGSQEGALLGAGIGHGQCEENKLTALIMPGRSDFFLLKLRTNDREPLGQRRGGIVGGRRRQP